MIVHSSRYEKQGWISITKQLPELRKKVRVCSIHLYDWNLESMMWEGEGKLRNINMEPSSWIVIDHERKLDKNLVFRNQITHWREIK